MQEVRLKKNSGREFLTNEAAKSFGRVTGIPQRMFQLVKKLFSNLKFSKSAV